MSKIDWYIEGSSFAACNCIYACPCQFEALPTHGNCRGFETLRIEKGHFDVDIDARKASVRIPNVLEASGRPIKSPATGNEHRVRIDIPNGIEFEIAEIGSGTVTAQAGIKLDLRDTYGQFNRVRHSRTGVVHG